MKNLYIRGFMLLACCHFFSQTSLRAQCTCSGGIPATAINQTISISPTKTSTLNFNFQQFDPSIGNLSCVSLHDTITGISTTGIGNTSGRGVPKGWTGPPYIPGPPIPEDTTIFQFLLSLVNEISGPGIDISNTFTTIYGPDSLAYLGVPGDTITHGPDNIITNPNGFGSAGGNAAYLGMGTVGFAYTINGGLITLKGGSNFNSSITTVIGGTLKLTYYWCPTIPLGTAISNFSVFKKNGNVTLQWLGTNDQKDIVYEIEYSNDNEHWQSTGTVPAGSAPTGTVAQYQYQYNPSHADLGQIYFRIKRTDAEGNTVYSVIKAVNLQQADQRPGIQIYPNPVTRNIVIQFDEQQTGNFSLELVSATGQIIQRTQVQLNGTSFTNMDLSNKPASGIYFLRAVNPANNRAFLTKVIVN
jgi:hypothetical protein